MFQKLFSKSNGKFSTDVFNDLKGEFTFLNWSFYTVKKKLPFTTETKQLTLDSHH